MIIKPTSYAALAGPCLDEDYPLIRELLSYEMICPISCIFARGALANVVFANTPSPMHWSRQREWPWILREGDFQQHHRVLDIGSGWSILKFAMATRTHWVDCLEINPEFIKKAQVTIDQIGFDNIKQTQGDMCELPFPDETFDRYVNCSVLEHVHSSKYAQCVKEAKRVLKPGGTALLTMDVVTWGSPKEGDFHMNPETAGIVVDEFGISKAIEIGDVMEARVGNEGEPDEIHLMVLMIRWQKP